MRVKSLKLYGYRNYSELYIEPSQNINIFIGHNAQGKTNILEAVYYASTGSSFRTNNDSDLIQMNQPGGSIRLIFERMGIENRLEFVFSHQKRRQMAYNGQTIRAKELIGAVNVVLFSPEDLFLIKGAPAGRRRFLDMELSQASPSYYHELIKYNHILQQRNSLLKAIREHRASKNMLAMWDEQLAESGAKLTTKRLESVKKLNMLANLMHRRISGNLENLSISYLIKGMEGEMVVKDLKIWYNEVLQRTTEDDILRGSTGIGPHRDDISISVNGIDLKAYGSQGQQRTGVLSMKLSELEFIRSETGEYPILLLDDVMSELDGNRRGHMLRFIKKENIQTFITATDMAYFPGGGGGSFFQVDKGRVEVVSY